MPTVIYEVNSRAELARSDSGPLRYEGNLYFAADEVNASALKITDRTYTCPYKGTCN
jgi:uncharacterized protein (DUF427 family)